MHYTPDEIGPHHGPHLTWSPAETDDEISELVELTVVGTDRLVRTIVRPCMSRRARDRAHWIERWNREWRDECRIYAARDLDGAITLSVLLPGEHPSLDIRTVRSEDSVVIRREVEALRWTWGHLPVHGTPAVLRLLPRVNADD